MTHEELLEAIDNKASYWHRNPLRAVVELHKPYLYPEDDRTYCYHCVDAATQYPCPTIQAIEKELK